MVSQLNTEQIRAQDYPLDDILAKAAEARDFVVQVKPSNPNPNPNSNPNPNPNPNPNQVRLFLLEGQPAITDADGTARNG